MNKVETVVSVTLLANDGGWVTLQDGTVERFEGVTEAAFQVMGITEFPDLEQTYCVDDPQHSLHVRRGCWNILTAYTDYTDHEGLCS